MTTTIQVKEETVHLLKQMRKTRELASYDDLILDLIRNAAPRKSMYGSLGKASWKDIMKDLRDKDDRF